MLPLLTTESRNINDLCHKLFCLLLYMGVLQQDSMPKLCFVIMLTICKDFLS